MKIAIPYQNGQVFPHFGHAPQFKFYTIELSLIHISEPTRPISISYAVFCLNIP